MSLFAHQTIGEPMIYPGHALVFAYLALVKYGSIDGALAMGEHYPACVSDSDLPGAGCGAWAGHDVLVDLREGMPINDVIADACRDWERRCAPGTVSPSRRYTDGVAQAERIKAAFIELVTRLRGSAEQPR